MADDYGPLGRALYHASRSTGLVGKIGGKVKTALYRRTANISRTARFLSDARILNPGRRREAITVGNDSIIRGELFAFRHGGKITIGDWCYIGEGSYIWSSANVTIGNRVLISHGVNIHDTNGHPTDAVERHAQFAAIATIGHPSDITTISASPVRIEDDAWIGLGAIIMKGVTIGKGAIVGAGSVVLHDVPAGAVVAGNPARIVRD